MDNTNKQVYPKDKAAAAKASTVQQDTAAIRVNKVIYFLLGLIEVLLIFRFIFKLLGANSLSGFVNLLYSITDTLMSPFTGVFGVSAARTSVIEWSIFVAMLVYWVLAMGLIQLVKIIFPETEVPA